MKTNVTSGKPMYTLELTEAELATLFYAVDGNSCGLEAWAERLGKNLLEVQEMAFKLEERLCDALNEAGYFDENGYPREDRRYGRGEPRCSDD